MYFLIILDYYEIVCVIVFSIFLNIYEAYSQDYYAKIFKIFHIILFKF